MTDVPRLTVIVPSRNRPGNISDLLDAWVVTDQRLTTLVVAVDHDDPELDGYFGVWRGSEVGFDLRVGEPARMCPVLNEVAVKRAPRVDHVGFMGDDHRPRTQGWDRRIVETLDEMKTGIVYGNDLIQGPSLPTAVFMTSNIVTTLGYMVPPGLDHLFADNAWLTWGRELGRLRYLSDVVIEHMHPLAGKAETDAGYVTNNGPSTWGHDEAAFNEYRDGGQLGADIAKLRELP